MWSNIFGGMEQAQQNAANQYNQHGIAGQQLNAQNQMVGMSGGLSSSGMGGVNKPLPLTTKQKVAALIAIVSAKPVDDETRAVLQKLKSIQHHLDCQDARLEDLITDEKILRDLNV